MADISKIKIPGSSTEYNVKDTVSGYVSTEATTSAKGLMSAADKTKLNGIASGAEVNQQAFSNVVVGTTTIAADSKTDTLTLVAGDNVTLTPNAAEDTITISSSSAGTVSTIKVGDTSYSPTSGIISLPAYPTTLPASDTVSTYSSTGTAPVNGKAVAAALGTLDGTVSGTAGVGKTLTAFSQTDGKVSATFGDISITKSQVSDFPTSMTPTSHTHGNIQNGGTLQTTDITIASGDKLVVTDSSNSNKIARASISFDGSTTTKALTPKGTFETFLQTHQSLTAYAKLASPDFTGTPTAPTATAGTNTTQIATTAFVKTAIDNMPEPMIFKGTVGDSSVTVTWANLPAPAAANEGFTYKATSARTTSQTSTLTQNVKAGDTIISNATNWVVIPSGDEPSGTVTSIATGTDLSGGTITSTGTISHANSGVTAGTYRSVTVNARGHVTAGTNPTTLSGYGITDAKIANGVITLGSNTITPITDISGKADKSATVSTVAYDTTNKKFTKTINGTTTNIAKLATTSVGSASAGTAIAADDITAWSAGSLPQLTVTNVTISTPVGIDSLLVASVSGSALTLSEVAVATASTTVGSASGWSAGTIPSLSYTARSIPNISVSSKTVATGFTTT